MATGYDEVEAYKAKTPKEEKVIRYLISLLLKERQTCTIQYIARQNRWREDDLVSFIDRCPDIFDRYQDEAHSYVKLLCPISICVLHCVKNKRCSGFPPECTGLHICKFYVLSGSCRFDQQCYFGHDLTTQHNSAVLREHFLDGLPVDDLKFLMKQTDSRTAATTPKICKFYNHHTGCRNTQSGKPCPFLHICKHYLQVHLVLTINQGSR